MSDVSASSSLLAETNLSDLTRSVKFSFPNVLSEFVYTRTYSRWVSELGRRETWAETIGRYVAFIREQRPGLPAWILRECEAAILAMQVVPSMRSLWCAGPSAVRDNTCMYNCSFLPIDSLKSFAEALYVLMQGTGVGFSVERKFTNNLPVVAVETGVTVGYSIPDSTEGWADALFFGLCQWFKGNRVRFDYSNIRPYGAILKTKGGRASGPEPLMRLMEFAERTILGAVGRKLSSLECHDLVCQIGEIVVVGGVRRSALISISDPDDEEIRHAKKFVQCQETGCGHFTHSLHEDDHLLKVHGLTPEQYLEKHPGAYMGFPGIRFMSNNSAYYAERPDAATFAKEWAALVASGSGERGFSIDSWHRRANRPAGMVRTNPCGEIGLRYLPSIDPITGEGGGGQFCNLTAAVMRASDTRETFAQKVRLATWMGVIQATFTHFPYLRPGWAQTCNEDRLLGVDITGQCDNPRLSTDPEAMSYFNRVAIETAAEASAYLGINMPVAITCGKPSGNSSQLLDCASGFHPRYAAYYIRRVRIARADPLFALVRDAGVPVHKEVQFRHMSDEECPTWVVEFPVAAPVGAMTRTAEGAVEMCNRYLHVMRTWCGERGHNQSATIYVRDHEWDAVGQWVFEHFDEITGLSFLPFSGGNYELAPYTEITKEEYEEFAARMPEVDFGMLSFYEQMDMGQGAVELACVGGACEV